MVCPSVVKVVKEVFVKVLETVVSVSEVVKIKSV